MIICRNLCTSQQACCVVLTSFHGHCLLIRLCDCEQLICSTNVWLCLLITLIIVGPIFWFVHINSSVYKYLDAVNEFGFFKLQYCVFFCYSSLLQQGCPAVPLADSGRIFAGFWLLFTIIMTVTYMGNLFAFLFSPQIEFPINTLDEVITKSNSWGVLGGSVIEHYLQVFTVP